MFSRTGSGARALVDPVETGVDERGEREIRVTGRVRGSVPRYGLAAGRRRRLADERRAVPVGPRDVDGCFVARDEPFVAVDRRVRDGRDGGRVFEDAREELFRGAAQVELVVLVVEGVLPSSSKSDMWVCIPEPLIPAMGLGMNVAWRSCLGRDGADDRPEGGDVVGRRERVVVGEVDLVLAVGRPRGGRLRFRSPCSRARR